VPCRIDGGAGAGRHDALELELGEPFAAVAPGQTACLLAGDVVLGHGTIAPTLRS
jgi:tRNA U34 2-thiouridine synthase MnmA/TrmU